MKTTIITKNYNANDKLKEAVEKKIARLDKFFSDEIEAKVKLTREGAFDKVEATITSRGTTFRAEEKGKDILDCTDRVVDKLSSQMSRFKKKLQRKHKDSKDLFIEALPELPEEKAEIEIVRTKKFQLEPMDPEEAILQMELLDHNFYVFLNMKTDSVNVVYKRDDGCYGLLETTY